MSNIATITGIRMDPTNPKPDDFVILDIGHALSLMTRANGHFKTFYSVAQHCIGCYKEAVAREYSSRVALGCLLHDASEAYLSDITRPVKVNLPKYKEYESVLQNMIFDKWISPSLTEEELHQIFEIDDIMLYYEFLHFTDIELFEPQSELLTKDTQNYDFVPFAAVEEEYIKIFSNLIKCV